MLLGCGMFCPARSAETIAVIRIYNPTKSSGPAVIEVPVGEIGSPGLVDWRNVRLRYHGENLPFGLREGKAHWKAALIAPIQKPRAEDLLVFQLSVAPETWAEIKLERGDFKSQPALVRKNGKVEIAYPNLSAVIDEQTGLLNEVKVYGESVLQQPFRLQFFETGEGFVQPDNSMGPGYDRPALSLLKGNVLKSPAAKLVSWSSTEALTELNFELRLQTDFAIGLTYRLHPNGQIEILADERPWRGKSPWLRYGVEFELALTGVAEQLPEFQTHYPFFGFKGYAASVQSTGNIRRGTKNFSVELGEAAVNGRFWHRRLAFYPETAWNQREDLWKLLDEGMVIKTFPLLSQTLPKKIQVVYADEIKGTAGLLVETLKGQGIAAASQRSKTSVPTIALNLISDPGSRGIEGDGFSIEPLRNKKNVEIAAGTTFGLFQGIMEITRHFQRTNDSRIPLVSRNPIVGLRAGGFGGGPHEVDFPYGTEAEWQKALSEMAASGMNVMTALGMWSNWKMPVTFKYMPELQSDSPSAHDEVSGANFAEFPQDRARALRLLQFLHDRGVKVWLWIPVGAIPTTFEQKFPEATVAGHPKVPRFMHPKYRQYLAAYFKELLEVYPVDGFVLIRDDNGGVDDTEEFKNFLAGSRTRHPVWEQHLMLYELLRSLHFQGQIAVYPYFDGYEPRLESSLPPDLLMVGHGSGLGTLTRHFEVLGPMGDTWLDNLYAGFRVPTSARTKRLLGDRGSYWIGGAYRGTELPWESIGYFGWQPTASVNSFRYQFGEKNFGEKQALDFLRFSDAYEHLWEIMNVSLLPFQWLGLPEAERVKISEESRRVLMTFRQRLNELKAGSLSSTNQTWFAQVDLYDSFFYYHLRRVELFGQMEQLAVANQPSTTNGNPLPEALRKQWIALQHEAEALARAYEQRAAAVPGEMMNSTRASKITAPFQELFLSGFDRSLDFQPILKVKQFDGEMKISASPLNPEKPFALKIEIRNGGFIPWTAGVGLELELAGETKRLGLPERWAYEGDPMVFGDRRIITLRGEVPKEAGAAQIKINFIATFRDKCIFLSQPVDLRWP
ncbi:MAG: hypothetical protein ABJC04_03490 [Verrucomicrobiota bacterium]